MAGKAGATGKIGQMGQHCQTVISRESTKDDDTTLTPEQGRRVLRGMKQIKQGRFKVWGRRNA